MNRRLLAVTPVDHPGGAEIGLLRLLDRLARRDWEIVLTSPGDGPLRDAALERVWRWEALPLGGLGRHSGARAIAAWPKARRLARGFDVVYLNGTVCGRLLPALGSGSAKRVLHVHDFIPRVPRHWRRADLVLADSQAVAERLTGLSAHVVYCPVEPDPPDAAPPWPSTDGAVVGFVGRIERRKGVLDLVHAAPEIKRTSPGARVVLIGEDPYGSDPAYTRRVTEDIEIEHHPWTDDAPGLMRHLDVLVLPSHEEPFGTVAAEAMAVGTPVVATRVGGIPEVVQDGVSGRLVEPGDPRALADAVREVLAHRREMGAAARESARRFYVDRYVESVERLIGG